jgi:4-amino-4-deoxy-L-arabinose transferase-like glycosyltransferase
MEIPLHFANEHAERLYGLWLSAILLIGLILRLFAFSGMLGTDDAAIAGQALRLLEEGPYLPDSHYAGRVGLIYPLAFVFWLFGVGEWQLALLPMAAGMLGIWLAFAIGRELGSAEAGLLAALLLALYPLDVATSSQFFPDQILGAALALSLFLVLRVVNRPEPSHALAFVAGLVWGYAYLVKSEAVFMGVVFLPMLWLYRNRWREALLVMAGAGSVALAENLVYYLAAGEWFYRGTLTKTPGLTVNPEFSASQLWVFPKAWFVTFYEVGLYFYLGFAALLWAVLRRKRQLLLISIWFGFFVLWHQFGFNPFHSTISFKSHLIRYLNVVNIPLAILAGFFLLKGVRSRLLRRFSLAVVVLSALFFINFNTLSHERHRATKIAVEYARDNGLFPLYLGYTGAAIAKFLLYDDPRRDQVHTFQHHDFVSGKTEMVPVDSTRGYLLVVPASMQYLFNRYYMRELDIGRLKSKLELMLKVENPMNGLAYRQAQLLVFLGSLLPVESISRKIMATGNGLLRADDALLFKMGGS